jgi:Protein of Unknown function (DUF2784)
MRAWTACSPRASLAKPSLGNERGGTRPFYRDQTGMRQVRGELVIYRVFADGVLTLHFGFVLFVVFGGLLVMRWPKLAWIHVPAAAWGVIIEYAGWICPLTPLENWLRSRGGEAGYAGGFVEHYLLATLYPQGLTRGTQFVLGGLVLVINVAAYATLVTRKRRTA